MSRKILTLVVLMLTIAAAAAATTFVVPTDEQMVAKSRAIVTGTVEGSYVLDPDGDTRTVYEVRVEQSIKGVVKPDDLIHITSPGGAVGERGVIVVGAAHFRQGEHVLLFLTQQNGEWTPTDMALGKFRFATSTSGEHLLVRDMEDVVGWDQAGNVHHEKVRRESGFLQFIQENARGHRVQVDYQVDSSAVTLAPDTATSSAAATAAPFPAQTYTSWVGGYPTRWASMATAIPFWKRSDQNIAGASDGGVSVIQNGLAAWNNECGSVINLTYAGQRATASTNYDGISVVEFNDPQGRISGSWTGSGTIAITFISYSGTHSFNGVTWYSIMDADVVFQDGFPATNAAFPTAMTHELGHAIGWRHSNEDYQSGACNSAVEECTTAAIMNSYVNSSYGYTLQPWDIHAAESVYPGGSCGTTCTPPSITTQPASKSITSGTSVTLTVAAAGTSPLSYQWYIGAAGVTTTPIAGATSSSLIVAPTATTTYWVRVSNACGAVNSAAATVTLTTVVHSSRGDFNHDGIPDLLWRNTSTGANAVWYMDTTPAMSGSASLPALSDLRWTLATTADFDGDGRTDLLWRNASTGEVVIWFMSGTTRLSTASLPSVSSSNWTIAGSADFDGDGKSDVVWRNISTGQNVVWLLNGNIMKSSWTLPAMADTSWTLTGAGDFNGDGKPDLLWRQNSTGTNVVWFMNGAAELSSASLPNASSNWRPAAIGDYTGDGKTDIIWRNISTGQNVVWALNGVALISTPSLKTVSDLNWTIAGPR